VSSLLGGRLRGRGQGGRGWEAALGRRAIEELRCVARESDLLDVEVGLGRLQPAVPRDGLDHVDARPEVGEAGERGVSEEVRAALREVGGALDEVEQPGSLP